MNTRENMLRTIRFERPDYIPMQFHINGACWHHYDQHALQDLMADHPFLFPDFSRNEMITPRYEFHQRKDVPYTDPWGCVWETSDDGIMGTVRSHPLSDWSGFEHYEAPDPNLTDGACPIDWNRVKATVDTDRECGRFVCGGLPHGHTFLRLQDIRGYEGVLIDMMEEDPRLLRLIGMIAEFNEQIVSKWVELQPDMLTYPEDLGMQSGPMLSPECFRKYIKPVYRRIMKPARNHGCIVHMHSDGDIRTLADDLIEGGVDVINLQDLVNGIDWISNKFAGRVCIDLDIDRQQITPHGTPDEIDALIRSEVEQLGSKEGGLLMIYGLYPGVPLKNIKALMDAMETYALFYA